MSQWHSVWASSFADPEDVRNFRHCKAAGHSDETCFKVGDNGVGMWDDDVSEGTDAACALPPEVMEYYFGATEENDWEEARNKEIIVAHGGLEILVKIRDRMPHLRTLEAKEARDPNRTKFRIDLNPTACERLGINIPAEALVRWSKSEKNCP